MTIGYDVRESTSFVLDAFEFPALAFVPKEIGISVAGLHDTIAREDFVISFPINNRV